ncbi:histidine kinase [Rhodospirillum rubrum]|uniref:chemotaxis protein CheB n=1 Tax=Rhodospirillum rubrum TaxID=1085 RepID=UPI001906F0B5|nr:chemotaxis protein CheB [Rhodospirillum rubrum]MBK1663164.1 histidine kinase [Rhodospirillum rubrum]MBK1675181.1 histidine kinase [Rhodospirillum rubrum]
MPRRLSPWAGTVRSRLQEGAPPTDGASEGTDGFPEAERFRVVGIGASAGGLEACKALLAALPDRPGIALILVQHLDPTHESMMVALLALQTTMTVCQAAEGMIVEPDHLYVIPPGAYLSVAGGTLHLSPPQARHGARLPFDFLLHSLAADYTDRAICVVLSGTGADGSQGSAAVKERGGLVIVQDPDEAGYDGMPRSAIATGQVDLVLSLAKIAETLVGEDLPPCKTALPEEIPSSEGKGKSRGKGWVYAVIDLLRARTPYDFTHYKPGTLERRTERRMTLAAIETSESARYLALLQEDATERDFLAKDLLINVTGFFRDPKVFDALAEKIIPQMVATHPADQPLRLWVAGCSTGEETYSLAMLFREAISATGRPIKVQVFASDVDPDAVLTAREGRYPSSIEADVSTERLARFFTRDGDDYRILPDLRSMVVFTVQDLLADPPFSRLDMVSCRNLLIYLRPEAQAKVIGLFHFALREGGILLLGNSETAGNVEGRFEVLSKSARLYRRIGRGGRVDLRLPVVGGDGSGAPRRPLFEPVRSRQAALADLCRRLVVEAYAPAAVLITLKYDCLYFLGAMDSYLRVAAGHPVADLLGLAREEVRTKLRSAIEMACETKTRTLVTGGRLTRGGTVRGFSIAVHPVSHDGEDLLLVCFLDEPPPERRADAPSLTQQAPRVTELEQELEITRGELKGAIRNLEISSEEQKAINEEALSVSEEYQATNEELLASKEELQSLNEELTALNGQLHETLERQRTTSNDLQNVLYSTDVATLFLDTELNIRFFTPATKLLFRVIPGDIGRPLADLSPLVADDALLGDAAKVLKTMTPIECEIEARSGSWYLRRILPYRTQDNGVEGVVITFADITERRWAADAREVAKRQAQIANMAKSRFLAAASHDLRQPLQTLTLLQGLLAKKVEGVQSRILLARMDETLGAMASMLNALLDINQIEVGIVEAERVVFPINDLFDRVREELAYQARAKKIAWSVVPCGLSVTSDPRLLEQMIRNLLANALKYTKRGKVLLGCRRRSGSLSIEVWDSGIGIPPGELEAIFDEFHQVETPAQAKGRGLGLGLSIVRRFGDLLDHPIGVRSWLGKGSVFTIDVAIAPATAEKPSPPARLAAAEVKTDAAAHRTGEILIIEDDPDVRDLLDLLLKGEGHRTVAVAEGAEAVALAEGGGIRPDLILADYNLPNGVNGLGVSATLRDVLDRPIPVVILTGDISTRALHDIALHQCVKLNKPVKPGELTQTIARLLPPPVGPAAARLPAPPPSPGPGGPLPLIYLIDDDASLRDSLRALLEDDGLKVEDYESSEAFLAAYRPGGGEACLLIDAYLPGMSGLDLLERLKQENRLLPSIVITGYSEVAIAVQAMKAGASDFIEKPVGRTELLISIDRALEQHRDSGKTRLWRDAASARIASLSLRQRDIMEMVLAGQPSKNIAADLGISQRTVESHRALIMKKLGVKSLPALARLAQAASSGEVGEKG